MTRMTEKLVAVVLMIAAAVGWYFGAYLPFQKSKRFIEIIHSSSVVKTVDELENRFDSVLDFYSPVGNEEIVSFFADQMVNVLSTKPVEEIGVRLIAYTEEKAKPVLEDSRNPELTKVLLKMASLNEIGWIVYQKPDYFRKAEDYLLQGLEVSPDRPQFLYGLFNLYASVGDNERARTIGEKILSFWPSDEIMRAKVNSLSNP